MLRGLAAGLLYGILFIAAGIGSALAQRAQTLFSDRPQYFNADRKIRVESANIVIDREARRATLHFEAAAMVRASFPDHNGPWVVLGFLDGEGRVIGPFKQVIEASVSSCGGYQRHEIELAERFGWSVIEQAQSFTIRMPGGANAQRCR